MSSPTIQAKGLARISSVSSLRSVEGEATVFDVAFSQATSAATRVSFRLLAGSASLSSDVVVGYKVSTDGGTTWQLVSDPESYTIPVGVSQFKVSVDTYTDAVSDNYETYQLGVQANDSAAYGTATIVEVPHIAQVIGQTVEEGNPATFRVNLSHASPGLTAVTLRLVDGNAKVSDNDYSPAMEFSSDGVHFTAVVNGQVWVPVETSQFFVRVASTEDTKYESDERFTLYARSPVGAELGADSVIQNDDMAPQVSSLTGASVVEADPGDGERYLVFDGSLTNISDTPTLVNVSVGAGVGPHYASAGLDFNSTLQYSTNNGASWQTASGSQFYVPENGSSFKVRVAINHDQLPEFTETLSLTVAANGGSATAQATIVDDDPVGVQSISSPSVDEGQFLVFDIGLTATTIIATPLSLVFSHQSTAAADFSGVAQYSLDGGGSWHNVPNNFSVPVGYGSLKVRLQTVNDSIYEEDETILLTATANGQQASGIGTILNNDAKPTVTSVTSAQANEGDALYFDVQLSNPSSKPMDVQLGLTNITTSDADYNATRWYSLDGGASYQVANGGVAQIPPGVTAIKVKVQSVDDTLFETHETFQLTATLNGSAASGTGRILDDDIVPVHSVSSPTVTEGQYAEFTVTMAAPVPMKTVVALALQNGSGVAGQDYSTNLQINYDGNWYGVSGGSIELPAGYGSFKVRTATLSDNVFEGNENFSLRASTSAGAATGLATIQDEDTAPKVSSVSNASTTEGGDLYFTVSLDRTSTTPTWVSLSQSGQSASGGVDYDPTLYADVGSGYAVVNGGVWVPAGRQSLTVKIDTHDDSSDESNETLTLTASANGGTQTGTGTLIDNDEPPAARITVHNIDTYEPDYAAGVNGDSNNGMTGVNSIPVTLDRPASAGIWLSYTLYDGTAVSTGSVDWSLQGTNAWKTLDTWERGLLDYVRASGSVYVPAGATEVSIPATVYADTCSENAEVFYCQVSVTSGPGILNNTVSQVVISKSPSPLVLDLDGNGVHSVHYSQGVDFDLTNDGTENRVGWSSASDGFLARDLNQDGQINNGSELFGNFTQVSPGVNAENGFAALAALDSDADGDVDANDSAFGTLKIWRDQDGDGDTDTGELVTLTEAGIARLNTAYTTNDVTENSNVHRYHGGYERTDGSVRDMVDVFFYEGMVETTPPPAPEVAPIFSSVSAASVQEGDYLVFDTRLVSPLDHAITVALTFQGTNATESLDYGVLPEVSVDGGLTWVTVGGTEAEIPSNTAGFLVRITSNDLLGDQGQRTVALQVRSGDFEAVGSGVITDRDHSTPVTADPGVDVLPLPALPPEGSGDIPLSDDALREIARLNKSRGAEDQGGGDLLGEGLRKTGFGLGLSLKALPRLEEIIEDESAQISFARLPEHHAPESEASFDPKSVNASAPFIEAYGAPCEKVYSHWTPPVTEWA